MEANIGQARFGGRNAEICNFYKFFSASMSLTVCKTITGRSLPESKNRIGLKFNSKSAVQTFLAITVLLHAPSSLMETDVHFRKHRRPSTYSSGLIRALSWGNILCRMVFVAYKCLDLNTVSDLRFSCDLEQHALIISCHRSSRRTRRLKFHLNWRTYFQL